MSLCWIWHFSTFEPFDPEPLFWYTINIGRADLSDDGCIKLYSLLTDSCLFLFWSVSGRVMGGRFIKSQNCLGIDINLINRPHTHTHKIDRYILFLFSLSCTYRILPLLRQKTWKCVPKTLEIPYCLGL